MSALCNACWSSCQSCSYLVDGTAPLHVFLLCFGGLIYVFFAIGDLIYVFTLALCGFEMSDIDAIEPILPYQMRQQKYDTSYFWYIFMFDRNI